MYKLLEDMDLVQEGDEFYNPIFCDWYSFCQKPYSQNIGMSVNSLPGIMVRRKLSNIVLVPPPMRDWPEWASEVVMGYYNDETEQHSIYYRFKRLDTFAKDDVVFFKDGISVMVGKITKTSIDSYVVQGPDGEIHYCAAHNVKSFCTKKVGLSWEEL
jgi:hypothetical protein